MGSHSVRVWRVTIEMNSFAAITVLLWVRQVECAIKKMIVTAVRSQSPSAAWKDYFLLDATLVQNFARQHAKAWEDKEVHVRMETQSVSAVTSLLLQKSLHSVQQTALADLTAKDKEKAGQCFGWSCKCQS